MPFQGFNVWRCLQYPAPVWFLMYYIVILSTLLQHLDHLRLTKLGNLLGAEDRLLAGRA